ncbi:50S ribosomal protein L18 [candidate division WOR-1 bacterium RIFOXYC2_FULL_37_10]|uniref:Large ribosomal subunit protein uL18 n=1 Tax=candidate division WOR-1 bacterium RIFOXYB2_FULL_37_13 TaxID=1802579 RepID=A0A1F4SRX6_UNCSA|nr:MAG: 50S ribosomal protein L18 [candidate division WOR-1 bacterium RIFOXYA2_FULL_37_7]OGC23190.1 MAG: 50S ribosomal protein L18 [candidate division WOR-1 bacterium RIFOXYB2_FULL_37_13]OGC33553.1 MAG: 50S ribosomal protein L18 [candidate division WOR-1 bacterium RIFOXYC2_FULL_37_10]
MNRKKKKKIFGNSERLRLSVYKSLKHLHAQIINDDDKKTVIGLSTKIIKEGNKTEKSSILGKEMAKKAIEAGVLKVVFDRGRFKYHGRIKAFANAAREGGLSF